MTKGRIALLAVAAMVFLSVGFVIGQMVQASGTVPGTAGDPLVAQSYVEKIVGETVADLEGKLDEMEAKVEVLQQKINNLTAASTGNSGNNSGTGSSGSTPKEPAVASSGGKTVAVTGNSANVRTGPGTNYEKITTLLKGDTAKLILEENSWYKVTLRDGKEGWIANWLVEVK